MKWGRRYRNREIAERLFISEETVKIHIEYVINKLGAVHRTQGLAIAVRRERSANPQVVFRRSNMEGFFVIRRWLRRVWWEVMSSIFPFNGAGLHKRQAEHHGA